MKKIILSEEQSKNLANILKEDMGVQQMLVDKKMNKPFYVDPEKVKIVKKYLDGGFTPHDFEKVGDDGYPVKCKIITSSFCFLVFVETEFVLAVSALYVLLLIVFVLELKLDLFSA